MSGCDKMLGVLAAEIHHGCSVLHWAACFAWDKFYIFFFTQ